MSCYLQYLVISVEKTTMMKRSTAVVMVAVLVVLLAITQDVDSWLFRRIRIRFRRYWERVKPQVVPALVEGLIRRQRSTGEANLDELARSLELDQNSEEFRQLREIADENADGILTVDELNSLFND